MYKKEYLEQVLEVKSTEDLEKELDNVLDNIKRLSFLKEINKDRNYDDFLPSYISLANSISDEIFFRLQKKFYGE